MPDAEPASPQHAEVMQNNALATKGAVSLWSLAVAAGIIETIIAVTSIIQAGAVGLGLAANVGLRTLVFATAALLIVQYAKGKNWARFALAVLLGGIGLASMAIPTALGMLDGASFVQAAAGDLGSTFVVVRVIHLASVIVATVLTLLPESPLDRHGSEDRSAPERNRSGEPGQQLPV